MTEPAPPDGTPPDGPTTAQDDPPPVGPPPEALPAGAVPVTVRRAPRYGRFIATGTLLGALIAALIVLLRARVAVADYSLTTLIGYLSVLGGLLGGLLGAVAAVIADRRT